MSEGMSAVQNRCPFIDFGWLVVLVVLGFELKALCSVSRRSTT
jgi:hypothetical protein